MFLAILTACGGAEPVTEAPPAPAIDAELATFIKAKLREGGLPAVAASIVTKDGVAWSDTYGVSNVEQRLGVDEDTVFIVASISKTALSVSLMQLVERGLLDLDRDIEAYLPYSVRHPDFPQRVVTPRMLMAHTGGLRDDWIRLGQASGDGDSAISLREFSEGYVLPGGRFYGDSWGNEPGQRRRYCNAAFGVLGDLVEAVGGRPLPELANEQLFDPLGMTNSGWHLTDIDSAKLATPYAGTWDEGFTKGKHQGFGFYPATGMRSSLADMSKFVRAFLRGGELDGTRILAPVSAAELQRVQFPDLSRTQALVWRYETINGTSYIGHSGSTVGGSSIIAYDVGGSFGIVLLTNSDAFIRARFGMPEGGDAIDAIVAEVERFAKTTLAL